jgi:hypothetical protein
MDGSGFGAAARVAVLVDGDNVPSRHAAAVMAEASRLGRADVRRVYGDAAKFGEWDGFRVMHAGGAKNAADMFLVVDAMALALSEGVEAFVIASSDRDFAPVALALRERGKTVIGVGGVRAGLTFQRACSRFVVLEEADKVVPVAPAPSVAVPAQLNFPVLADGHRRAVEMLRENGGAMLMEDLARGLRKKPEGTARWQSALKQRPDVFHFVGEGRECSVRLAAGAAKLR